MLKQLGLTFALGASVGASFKGSLGFAESKIKGLGESIRRMEGQGDFKLGQSFDKLKTRLSSTASELAKARQRLEALNREAESSGGMSGMMATRFELAEREVARLSKRLETDRTALRNHAAQVRNEGREIGGLVQDYARLGNEIDLARRRRDRFAKFSALGQRAKAGLDRLNPLALGASLAAPVMLSVNEEQPELRLRTAINSKDSVADLERARREARAFSRTGLATYTEGLNIQYALNSAGMEASIARAGMGVVARVAKITGGQHEGVGEVLATAYNNLGHQIQGTAEEKFNRVGELLTRTQLKFQIRNFDQLGESMNKGAGAMATYNVNLAQGVTMLGALNSAGRQGSEAGTAFSAMLRQLGKAEDLLKFKRVRDASGQLDVVGTLEALEKRLAGKSQDKRAAMLQAAFGDEGMAAVAPLLIALPRLRAEVADVRESSKGVVAEMSKWFEGSKESRLNRIRGQLTELGATLGDGLFPLIEAITPALGQMVEGLVDFGRENQGLVRAVGYTLAGLLGLKAALFVLGPAGSVAVGAFRLLGMVLPALSAGLFTAGGAARLFGLAVRTAMLGAGIGILLVGLGLLIEHWDTVKVVALRAWEGIKAGSAVVWEGIRIGAAWAWEAIKTVFSWTPLGMLIESWQPARDFFNGLWDGLKTLAGAAWEGIKTVFSWTPLGMLIEHWQPVKDFFAGLWDFVIDKIGIVGDAIMKIPFIDKIFGGGKTTPVLGASVRQAGASPKAKPAPLGASLPDLPVGQPVTVARPSPEAIPVSGARLSEGGVTINYQPTFQIQGGDQAAVRGQVEQAMATDRDELRRMVREELRRLRDESRRLGYG